MCSPSIWVKGRSSGQPGVSSSYNSRAEISDKFHELETKNTIPISQLSFLELGLFRRLFIYLKTLLLPRHSVCPHFSRAHNTLRMNLTAGVKTQTTHIRFVLRAPSAAANSTKAPSSGISVTAHSHPRLHWGITLNVSL